MPPKKEEPKTKKKATPRPKKETVEKPVKKQKLDFEHFLVSYNKIQQDFYRKDEQEIIDLKAEHEEHLKSGHYTIGRHGGLKVQNENRIESLTDSVIRTSEKIIHFIQSDSLLRIANALEEINKKMK